MAIMPPAPPREHVETGVFAIEMAASTVYNRTFTPRDGWVKWFRDYHGQLWVKFQSVDSVGDVREFVWPADRVVCVLYKKS